MLASVNFFKSNLVKKIITQLIVLLGVIACKNEKKATETRPIVEAPEGMVWVEKKTFLQGAKASDEYAMYSEKPAHQVTVDGFFIDQTEVTNEQFSMFVNATNYVTVAERLIDWEQMKRELPPNTPKPHDSIFQPGSLIFNKNVKAVVNMQNYTQWWTWKVGANWKHPQGPESDIKGRANYPVVHIAYEDALAYCKWANRRLPTEAEWESAAQGTQTNAVFTWGNDQHVLTQKANTWQGTFPTINQGTDGYKYAAPIKSFAPNTIGLYDMSGNVWEITSDFYNAGYYQKLDTNKPLINPKGANKAFNPANPYVEERVIKGGSFLCHASYCASFRISARMGFTPDSGSDHVGFRTVADIKMIDRAK